MNVYSARSRFVGLALYTATDNRDCVSASRLVDQYTRSKQKAGRLVQNTNQGAAVIDRKARYSLRIEILAYPACIRGPR